MRSESEIRMEILTIQNRISKLGDTNDNYKRILAVRMWALKWVLGEEEMA